MKGALGNEGNPRRAFSAGGPVHVRKSAQALAALLVALAVLAVPALLPGCAKQDDVWRSPQAAAIIRTAGECQVVGTKAVRTMEEYMATGRYINYMDNPLELLATHMPYYSMPEEWVDATVLGPPSTVEEHSSGSRTYRWYRYRGKDGWRGLYYLVLCQRGEAVLVREVESIPPSPHSASGTGFEPLLEEKPDPADYDEEDDYEPAGELWFQQQGVEDVADATMQDWEDNAEF